MKDNNKIATIPSDDERGRKEMKALFEKLVLDAFENYNKARRTRKMLDALDVPKDILHYFKLTENYLNQHWQSVIFMKKQINGIAIVKGQTEKKGGEKRCQILRKSEN